MPLIMKDCDVNLSGQCLLVMFVEFLKISGNANTPDKTYLYISINLNVKLNVVYLFHLKPKFSFKHSLMQSCGR